MILEYFDILSMESKFLKSSFTFHIPPYTHNLKVILHNYF